MKEELVRSAMMVISIASGVVAGGCADARSADSPKVKAGLDTAAWGRVLERYAHAGGLDYAGLAADRADLDAFLVAIERARPTAWSRDEQLAFWSNAYNAVVAEFVLESYPDLESVRDVDGFFDSKRRTVAGEELTLDEIESRGRELGDPRIHFAVVCASTSCPDLAPEPFEGARIDDQLERLTRQFLADPQKGLRYDEAGNTLWLSSIFKWYAGDFTGGSTVVAYFARGKVVSWILPYLPTSLRESVAEREPSVRYLDYDWSLNDR